MSLLGGKTAIVTGGSSGIGASTARVLAGHGASVVIADVDVQRGEEVVREIVDSGAEALFLETDVSEAREVRELVHQTAKTFGGLDVMFNNAGVEGPYTEITEYDEEEFDRVVAVNFKGVWLGMKYAAEEMLSNGGGSIINTASIAGVAGFANFSGYNGSKAALIQSTKTVALEYAPFDVRANVIAPGIVRTPMIERRIREYPEREQHYEEAEPMEGLTDPVDVAHAVLFLGSDLSARITGVTLPVDGGYLAG